MQFTDRIDAIERRCSTVNLSLWRACRDAGVEYTRLQRWKSGENSPTVDKLNEYLGKLEDHLSSVERGILDALARPPVSADDTRIAS